MPTFVPVKLTTNQVRELVEVITQAAVPHGRVNDTETSLGLLSFTAVLHLLLNQDQHFNITISIKD